MFVLVCSVAAAPLTLLLRSRQAAFFEGKPSFALRWLFWFAMMAPTAAVIALDLIVLHGADPLLAHRPRFYLLLTFALSFSMALSKRERFYYEELARKLR